jgi:hypothetical protein
VVDISDCRIVHFVATDGHHWPLLVTSVKDGTDDVNGRVFCDAEDLKVVDVPYSDELDPYSWHFRERVP